MHSTLKISGVRASSLAAIHDLVNGTEFRTTEPCYVAGDEDSTESQGIHPYASVKKVKFDPESGTYVVTLKINLKFLCREKVKNQPFRDHFIFTPSEAVQALLRAVDEQMLPTGGKAIKVPSPEEIERLRWADEDWRYVNIIPELEKDLIGRTFHSDIVDGETGAVILPGRTKINRAHLWRLVRSVEKLDFSDGTDEVVVPALKAAARQVKTRTAVK